VLKSDGSRVQKADVLSYLESQKTAATTLFPASPKARRTALEHGLDVRAIRGSGPDGAVLTDDVMKAMTAAPTEPPTETAEAANPAQLSPLWRVMAERISRSWREIPHFHLARDVDAAALVGWYESLQGQPTKITYTDLIAKLVALALVKHPRFNASWQNENIIYHERVGIGLAVAVEDGLVVPVILDADRLPLRDIASQRQGVISRALAGTLTVEDVQGVTFTISNLGMYGIDSFSAIINPPNSAILAVGRIAERVVPLKGVPTVRLMMTLTIACDHRVIDGARAAEFLATLAGFIENPLTGIY
jgi:pyruvate dehydrogenase E2 component (dihydrolipoamide acetyltransferase)